MSSGLLVGLSLRVDIEFVFLDSPLEFELDLPLVSFFLVLDLESKVLWRSELNALVADRECDSFGPLRALR